MTISCPKCGHVNDDTASFCTNCGNPLTAAPQPVYDYNVRKATERTKTGLLLLIIGFLVSLVPFIDFIGIILAIVGVILIYMGAWVFGGEHRSFVLWSIVLYVLILIVGGAVVGIIFLQIFTALLNEALEEAAAQWRNFLIAIAVIGSVLGIPYLMITFKIQTDQGRSLLSVALITQIALTALSLWLLQGFFDTVADLLVTGPGQIDPFIIQNETLAIQVLSRLANILWALAYYLPYKRIVDGQLPSSPTSMTQGS